MCIRDRRQVVSDNLGIRGAGNLQPLLGVLGFFVKPLHGSKESVPVKGFSGLLLDKVDGIFDLISSIFLYTFLRMADRHCQLESRNLEASGLDAIAHGASITGCIALHRTPVSYTHLDVYKRQG